MTLYSLPLFVSAVAMQIFDEDAGVSTPWSSVSRDTRKRLIGIVWLWPNVIKYFITAWAKIGGLRVFRQSKWPVVRLVTVKMSVKINTLKMPQTPRRSWTHLFCVCLCMCGRQKPEDLQFEPNGWRRHYTGGIRCLGFPRVYLSVTLISFTKYLKGPYADHILIPQGSTGSSIFFDTKWKPIFFSLQIQNFSFKFFIVLEILQKVLS